MKTMSPKNLPQALLQRSISGDEHAFEQIFHDYKNLVFKTAYLMLRNEEDAEDILQTVFLKVHRSLQTYDSAKSAFTTWLHRITINQCLNFKRKKRFNLIALTQQLENLLVSPTDQAAQVEDRQSLDTALSHLSEKLRPVIVLRYYWDMSYAEIAMTMEIPLGTVKSRLSQAVEKLAPLLDAPGNKTQKEMENEYPSQDF